MKREEAVDFVIQELGKHHPHNEVIVALCQKTGMAWPQAEQFVHEVEMEHKHTITSRQSPLIITMSVTFIVVGLGLALYGGVSLLNYFQRDALGMALGVRGLVYRIGSILTGIGMVIGGILGLLKTITALFRGGDKE